MATMPLEDIQFPGNPNTYTFTQLDDSETGMGTTGKAPDSHAVDVEIKALKDEMETTAKVDGSYENMKVGLAENLDPTVFIEDTAAYTFRTTGGNADVGDFEKMSTVVGGSLNWNQLAKFTASVIPTASNGITYTYTDGTSVKITGTATAIEQRSGWFGLAETTGLKNAVGHKILFIPKVISGSYTGTVAYSLMSSAFKTFDTPIIREGYKNNSGQIRIETKIDNGTVCDDLIVTFICCDLTALFGPTIADYIYSLEQATEGAGVAWFRRYFPKEYYAYCEPHFEHVQVQAHETVGFNAIDPAGYKIGGAYNPNKGSVMDFNQTGATVSGSNPVEVSVTTGWKGAAFISPVIGGLEYQLTMKCSAPTGGNIRVSQYLIDENDAVYSSTYNFSGEAAYNINRSFTPSRNGLRNVVYVASTSAQKVSITDLSLHLKWDGSRNGEYESYDKRSYPLDPVVLRGIPKIDASGNLYFDGDTYKSDGASAHRYREYKITETNIVASGCVRTTNGLWCAAFKAISGVYNCVPNKPILCDKLMSYGGTYTSATTDCVCQTVSPNFVGTICLTDATSGLSENSTAEEAAAALNAYFATNQPTCIYELATPTTEEADSYLETQWVNDFGTERFVPASSLTRDVEVPVGHVTKYPPDLKAKLEMVPNSPPSNGLWLVQHEDGVNTYVQYIGELPADPDEDGSYYLKATRSSGTTTLSWEAQE